MIEYLIKLKNIDEPIKGTFNWPYLHKDKVVGGNFVFRVYYPWWRKLFGFKRILIKQ